MNLKIFRFITAIDMEITIIQNMDSRRSSNACKYGDEAKRILEENYIALKE